MSDRTSKGGPVPTGKPDPSSARRPALGRGLSSLLPSTPVAPPAPRGFLSVPVHEVTPEREQPRRYWDTVALSELAASVKARGIIQPILVRRLPEGGYRIVAGERRWRAAQVAELKEIPIIVKDVSAAEAFELALIENIQREDLNPIEEAEAYHRLLNEHGLTQDALATRVGKERSTITNALRLLKLPNPIREQVASGTLTVGHAKVLLGVEDAASMAQLAHQISSRGISVRETERLVQKARTPAEPPAKERAAAPVELRALVRRLERALNLPCELRLRTSEAGELVIRFESLGKADELLQSMVAEFDPLGDARSSKESA
jgi:ParB family chromosome partitioning protein